MNDVKKVLTEARGLVERGWCKHASSDGKGNFCLRGAVEYAAGVKVLLGNNHLAFPRLNNDLPRLMESAKAYTRDFNAIQIVREHLPQGHDCVVLYNDDPTTTKDDVLAVLDKAICAC